MLKFEVSYGFYLLIEVFFGSQHLVSHLHTVVVNRPQGVPEEAGNLGGVRNSEADKGKDTELRIQEFIRFQVQLFLWFLLFIEFMDKGRV